MEGEISMRVLHVTGPSTGGIKTHINQLQHGLTEFGIESSVFTQAKVRPSSIWAVARELKRGKYDLIHCHGYQGGAVGRSAANLARVPAVMTLHNTLQIGGMMSQLAQTAEGRLWGNTARWIAVSAFLHNYARGVLGVPEERLEVITNGIEFPDALPPRHPKPVVGIVARLIPSKGVDVFLKAIQLLRPEVPGLQAVVIGDGPARYQLKAMAHHLGLNNVVRFWGHQEDVTSHLARMAVFVLPTRSEGLGISVLEAMAWGVPVVTTRVGGIPELVRNNSTGILVRQDDYTEVARAVRRVFADGDLAEAMRQRAYKQVRDCFNTQLMLEKTRDTYGRVVNA